MKKVNSQLADLLLYFLDGHCTIHRLIDEIRESWTDNVGQIIQHLSTATSSDLSERNN